MALHRQKFAFLGRKMSKFKLAVEMYDEEFIATDGIIYLNVCVGRELAPMIEKCRLTSVTFERLQMMKTERIKVLCCVKRTAGELR